VPTGTTHAQRETARWAAEQAVARQQASAPEEPQAHKTYVFPTYKIPKRGRFGFESKIDPIATPSGAVSLPGIAMSRGPALALGIGALVFVGLMAFLLRR
jgi:hypothetical protein